VQDHLKDLSKKEAAVVTAAQLMHERQQKQAMLVTKYLYEEFKQFHYFSLAPSPPISLPEDPQSTDILKLQQALEGAYTAEISRQATAGKSAGWIYIEVNATAEPTTIAALAANGSTRVVLPIPLKNVTDPETNSSVLVADTRYHDMRVYDIGVYLLDAQGKALGGSKSVELFVTKAGTSYFFDKDLKLHVFSHAPVVYGGSGDFSYKPATACPVLHRGCGDLCPDYIRYSPYGTWDIQIFEAASQGVDMSKLTAVRFEFQVDFGEVKGPPCDIFGKNYPQDTGGGPPSRGCLGEGEIEALSA